VAHSHREWHHQGLGNRLIERAGRVQAEGRIRRRARLGGLLNYYERAA
jgi:histone acetyltransferase (RNA polymerase elongator complex component)